jgi:hypothetical protein
MRNLHNFASQEIWTSEVGFILNVYLCTLNVSFARFCRSGDMEEIIIFNKNTTIPSLTEMKIEKKIMKKYCIGLYMHTPSC